MNPPPRYRSQGHCGLVSRRSAPVTEVVGVDLQAREEEGVGDGFDVLVGRGLAQRVKRQHAAAVRPPRTAVRADPHPVH